MKSGIDAPSAPVSLDLGGGGGRGWVELLRATDDIEAHLLTGRLGEVGIETMSVKDRSAPGAWLYGGSNPWAPVAILVRKIQLEDARLVLAEISWTAPAFENASEAERRGHRSGAVAWWAAAIALGMIFTAIGLLRTAQGLNGCEIPIICDTSESNP
ncbi:MAG: DUF2007 domain-containing protein [Actinomycetota bacterium]|nr:DUF2007 domain-containing protein [Actinomycetota bacterium]